MPLQWKKASVTRISRLVADLWQSPKRGGSLVVETGFPTSLIDLFAKNRDRLKKPPKKKPSNQNITEQSPLVTPPAPCDSDREGVAVVDGDRSGGGGGSSLSWLLKVFVVVLGLGSRELAMRIMIAALFLLLVEYVGTRFLSFANQWPKSWVILKKLEGSKKDNSNGLTGVKYGEIQLVDENLEETCTSLEKGSKNTSLYQETGLSSEEKGETIEVLIRNEHARSRCKMRSNFIKKLALKKLKAGKKRESNKKIEPDECKTMGKGDEKLGIFEEEGCSGGSGYMILLSIVLAGLVGGKAIAFLLTVSWCVMIRIVGKAK